MHIRSRAAAVAAAFAVSIAFAGTAHAGLPFFNKKNKDHDAKVAQIPRCSKKLGSLSVIEPEATRAWWTGAQLPAPSKLLKVFVSKSGCFTLVDRSVGMSAALRERELAAGGELRGGSNLGKGQVKAADYVMVPDLIDTNRDAGGGGIGALASSLIGGKAGRIAGSVTFQSKTADVTLTVTDVRSSEQVAMVEGHGEKNDIGFGGRGQLWGNSGLGAAGLGGYTNTTQGQVIVMAYLDAYTKLVSELGGLPSDPSAANARQMGTMRVAAQLMQKPEGKGVVRRLEPGMAVYPTGNRMGLMWEVEDEHGNRGWVSSEHFDLAK
jgi:hypothetical protein